MSYNERFHETWMEHTCANGLSVVLFHKPQFLTSAFMLLTPFGSFDLLEQDERGMLHEFPAGTAHFLEHKLFESGREDVMMAFSRLGANVNASTSNDSTAYFFTTPQEEVAPALNLLLDFVQDLSISEETVEKEKTIIREELAMYMQDPDSRLFLEMMRSLYPSHPLRNDIVGTEESIQKITKEDLIRAHTLNCHPSRMTLIAASPRDPKTLIEIIEANQAKKQFPEPLNLKRVIKEENLKFIRPMVTVPMAIEHPRSAAAFLLEYPALSGKELLKAEWALRFALETLFSPLNPEYQKWIDEGKITAYFGCDTDVAEDHACLYFQDETADAEALKEFVREEIQKRKGEIMDEALMRQIQRRILGSEIRLFDSPSDLIGAFARCLLRGSTFFEECELVEALKPEECTLDPILLEETDSACITLVSDH